MLRRRVRFERPLLTTAMSLSFLLGIAIAIIWVRNPTLGMGVSLWGRSDWVNRRVNLLAIDGGYIVACWGYLPYPGPTRVSSWSGWGFGWWEYRQSGQSQYGFTCPCWFAVTLFSGWPLVIIANARLRQFRRRRRGLCVSCGYDLRGGHVTCPECGRSVSHDNIGRT